ncbi:GNAT family N-acetyltransferase [Thalassotalea agarivorans]|nr:GNAT family N-acetyltransferase [Thalassotalea agarivorans]
MGFDTCYVLADSPSVNNENDMLAAAFCSEINPEYGYTFLHGVVVKTQHQHQGLGSILVKHAINQHRNIYCFADAKLTPFYLQLNFVKKTQSNLPTSLCNRLKSYQVKHPNLVAFIHP